MKTKALWMTLMLCLFLTGCKKPQQIQIFIAGDSTAQTYSESKTVMRGWAQFLPLFFEGNVTIENRAKAGRSTKSFRAEGRWEKILEDMQPGDFVFIQFGHNDSSTKPERYASPEDYRNNLTTFIREAREKGGIPVLLTSIVLCTFNEDGVLEDRRLKEYPVVMREVAAAENVPLIDLFGKTFDMVQSLGETQARKLYMYVAPGEDPSKPDGGSDDTHLRERGALRVASLAAQGVREQKIKPLYKYLSDKVILASDDFDSVESQSSWYLESEVPWDSIYADAPVGADAVSGATTQTLPTRLSIHDGSLHIQTPKGATVWYKHRFQGNIRISFESCIVEDGCPYDRLSDMNCFWMATDPAYPFNLFARSDFRKGSFVNYYHLSMYYMGYGGNSNTTTRFRRYDGNEAAVTDKTLRPDILTEYIDAPHLLQANKWYRITIEVLNGRIRYYRNHELLVDYVDEDPYDEGYFGFRTTGSHAAFRDFSVEYIEE